MNCFFCHNEGMDNPRQPLTLDRPSQDETDSHKNESSKLLNKKGPSFLSTDQLLDLMNSFADLGGKQLNITGGEPLSHPDINHILKSVKKKKTKIVLNSNVLLAQRLLKEPKIENVDAIYASLHTVEPKIFKEQLGTSANAAFTVMENMKLLKKHGYNVQINYSLGDYNKDEFSKVLDFAIQNRIHLKAIALIRSNENPGFYGGNWIDPKFVEQIVEKRPVQRIATKEGFGGRTITWQLLDETERPTIVEVKNIATGRLITDYCSGCKYFKSCGEGIYALRSGVDGLWKPCLLNKDKYERMDMSGKLSWEDQILYHIDRMVGNWRNSNFVSGSPL